MFTNNTFIIVHLYFVGWIAYKTFFLPLTELNKKTFQKLVLSKVTDTIGSIILFKFYCICSYIGNV